MLLMPAPLLIHIWMRNIFVKLNDQKRFYISNQCLLLHKPIDTQVTDLAVVLYSDQFKSTVKKGLFFKNWSYLFVCWITEKITGK